MDGNRIRVTDTNGQMTYVYDTTGSISRMLMSVDQTGNIIKYVYGNGLIAQENSNGYYSYHYDMRGSTTALTNKTGTATDTYQYRKFK